MLLLDPTATVTFTLPGYEDKPEPERPLFIARVLSAREASRWPDKLAEIENAPRAEQCDRLTELLGRHLVSAMEPEIGGVRRPIEPGQLPDRLTLDALWSIPAAMLRASTLSGADKKKSVSPSASAAAGAAGAAA